MHKYHNTCTHPDAQAHTRIQRVVQDEFACQNPQNLWLSQRKSSLFLPHPTHTHITIQTHSSRKDDGSFGKSIIQPIHVVCLVVVMYSTKQSSRSSRRIDRNLRSDESCGVKRKWTFWQALPRPSRVCWRPYAGFQINIIPMNFVNSETLYAKEPERFAEVKSLQMVLYYGWS